jgi:serine/threonine-protein kinase
MRRARGSADLSPSRAARRRKSGPFVVLAVAVVVIAVAALSYRAVSSTRPDDGDTAKGGAADPRLTAIAVLPFDDLSPGGDHEWLANGFAEELIEMLSRTEALRVAARTSAQVAKKKGADIAAIGELLGVGSVVEGSVRRAGEQLRVSAQLVRVADGYQLWTGSYDGKLDDVFATQEQIGREIAEALRAELGIADTFSWLTESRYLPRDVRAYELVKKGVDLDPLAFEEASLREAIDYFSQALEIDPAYGQAHAQLAWSLYNSWIFRFDRRDETRELAKATAERAIQLEPTNSAAHNLLGYMGVEDHEWQEAQARYERAVAARPGHGPLRTGYGWLLLSLGAFEPAAVQMQRGVDLDPLYPNAYWGLGTVRIAQRDYPSAIATLERGAELGDYPSLADLPLAHHLGGMDRKALESWVRIAALRLPAVLPSFPIEPSLRQAFEQRGIQGASAAYLEAAVARAGRPCAFIPWWTARVHALVGNADRMFACLEQSIEERLMDRLAKVHPIYDRYRDDPRFQTYLRRVRLTE